MMTVGMLWFDDDRRRSLADKIRLAAQHYENKYGERPNICMLHPSTAGADGAESIEGMRVQINKQVLPAHLWIGRAEDALGIRKPLEQATERARIAQDGRKALMMNDWPSRRTVRARKPFSMLADGSEAEPVRWNVVSRTHDQI